MNREDILALWGKVQKGDREAKARFISEYLRVWPKNVHLTKTGKAEDLHIMFLHLYR